MGCIDLNRLLIVIGAAILPAAVLVFFFPLPSVESLPCFAAGLVFHMDYQIFLMSAYKVWSFTQAPIALVTVLQEASTIFALLNGVFVFRERLNLAKVVSTLLTLFGEALLRFGKLLA